MDWRTETRGSTTIIVPIGEVDQTNADAFRDQLIPIVKDMEDGTRLVIDLSRVPYMSSLGLRALMLASKEARPRSITVTVASLGPTLAEIFQISRFNAVFPVFDTVDEAVAG